MGCLSGLLCCAVLGGAFLGGGGGASLCGGGADLVASGSVARISSAPKVTFLVDFLFTLSTAVFM